MRKAIAMLTLFAFIGIWVWGVATIGVWIAEWNAWFQAVFYLAAGVLWVFPLRPVFRWMNSAPAARD